MDETAQLGPSSNGSVVLDIGGDIGALVLLTSADLLMAEIEISRVGAEADGDHDRFHDHGELHDHGDGTAHHHHPTRTHVAVRERRGPAGVQYAAIYFGLKAGDYTVWALDGTPADRVTIVGGSVAELDWR